MCIFEKQDRYENTFLLIELKVIEIVARKISIIIHLAEFN